MKTEYLCPISGSEWSFNDHRKIFKDHIQGSNCYSYAMNHPEFNGYRIQKSVPGDISKNVAKLVHDKTDWQSCTEAIKRILDDGKIMAKKKKIGTTIMKVNGSINKQMKKKPINGWRKILLVVDSNDEKPGVPTDFHFYAQNKIPIDQFYNIERKTSLCCNTKLYRNPYNVLDINAFSSNEHILRICRNDKQLSERLINNRALVNIRLHVDMLPDYALAFIVDPWWLLNLEYHDRTLNKLKEKYALIKLKISKNKIKEEIKQKMLKVLEYAKKECQDLLQKKTKLPPKHKMIGLWSHKLGWGTEPLNTDGYGKIILNPVKCQRYHGGYDYDLACQAFFVLRGHGFSST